jgi:hypothetical protein
MEVEVFRADLPWDDLFLLASRYNPRRGFIFVSKVLGKHWPVRPSAMAGIHDLLAARLAALDLEPPVVLIAMAETAVGLGRGVFAGYAALTGWRGALFLQTTRCNIGLPALLTASEPHCHAPRHTVYVPQGDPEKLRILRGARTLVLADDEISTGETLLSLARAFAARAPGLRRAVFASIASFLTGEARRRVAASLPVPLSHVSALEGAFSFRKTADLASPGPVVRSEGAGTPLAGAIPRERGRVGILARDAGEAGFDTREALSALGLPAGCPARVIGTGEFLHEPYLLARALEAEGREVVFQSTTRTPIAPGGGVGSVLRFRDNYGEGLDNFLYNAPRDFPGATVVCRETSASPVGFDVALSLGAREILL